MPITAIAVVAPLKIAINPTTLYHIATLDTLNALNNANIVKNIMPPVQIFLTSRPPPFVH